MLDAEYSVQSPSLHDSVPQSRCLLAYIKVTQEKAMLKQGNLLMGDEIAQYLKKLEIL